MQKQQEQAKLMTDMATLVQQAVLAAMTPFQTQLSTLQTEFVALRCAAEEALRTDPPRRWEHRSPEKAVLAAARRAFVGGRRWPRRTQIVVGGRRGRGGQAEAVVRARVLGGEIGVVRATQAALDDE